jgi:hypothetical protein
MSRFPIQISLHAKDYAAFLIGRLIMTWASVDEWLYGTITHCQHAKVMRGIISMGEIPPPSENFDNRVKDWRRLLAQLSPDPEMMRPIDKGIVELKLFSLVRHHFAHNLIFRIVSEENDDMSRIDIGNSKQMRKQIGQITKRPQAYPVFEPIVTYTFAQIIEATDGLERVRGELAAASLPIIVHRTE